MSYALRILLCDLLSCSIKEKISALENRCYCLNKNRSTTTIQGSVEGKGDWTSCG